MSAEAPLPLIEGPKYDQDIVSSPDWPRIAHRFTVEPLNEEEALVTRHFVSKKNVVFAGSYEGCSCGFNYGREFPDYEDDPDHLEAARESVAALVDYVKKNGVSEIYCCQFGDENLDVEARLSVSPDEIARPSFVFGYRELLTIV